MKKSGEKFGKKTLELFDLIEIDRDWEKYLNEKTCSVIKTLLRTRSMKETMEEHNMIYITVRSNILKAIERIKNKDTTFYREGKTNFAQELFHLIDNVEDWEQYVTPEEARIAKEFRELKNHYMVARKLHIKPSNVASALYGNTQRFGVITKIKNKIPQKKRFIKKEVFLQNEN